MSSEPAEPAGEHVFLGERLWPGVTVSMAIAETERLARAAEGLRHAGRDIRLLRSALVPGDETLFVWFSAQAAAGVVEVGERAGTHFDRIGLIIELSTPDLRSSAG